MIEKEKFPSIKKTTIIFAPTIFEQIEEYKTSAIKKIMCIVDTQGLDYKTHQNIRKIVLDSLNDMARAFETTTEKVVEKFGDKF